MQVEHVDFVSFLTQDIARARAFYTEVLGLEVETEGEHDMELRCGQVTLDVFDPSSIGQPFAAVAGRARAARARTSTPRARSSRRRASSSTARRSTPASATRRGSTIPTGTR